MAASEGIAKISGVAVADIAKTSGVAKANIWSVGGEQREASLFRTLTQTGWNSYTAGKNSASFVAVQDSSTTGQAYFQYDSNSSGDTYNFSFNKTGTQGARVFEIRIATNAALTTNLGKFDVGSSSGAVSTSITYNQIAPTIYIGFYGVSGGSANSLDISNLIVTKS